MNRAGAMCLSPFSVLLQSIPQWQTRVSNSAICTLRASRPLATQAETNLKNQCDVDQEPLRM